MKVKGVKLLAIVSAGVFFNSCGMDSDNDKASQVKSMELEIHGLNTSASSVAYNCSQKTSLSRSRVCDEIKQGGDALLYSYWASQTCGKFSGSTAESCYRFIRNTQYNKHAANTCYNIGAHNKAFSCLKVAAGQPYQSRAVKICNSVGSASLKLKCIDQAKGRVYSDATLSSAEKTADHRTRVKMLK